MAHVFIVNETTFKYHLEYLFAGTGADESQTNFLFDAKIELTSQKEKTLIGMISDITRIKKGDKIIFFVTGISKFYGIFEAASDFFLDPSDEDNFLAQQLNKILTFRIHIKPYRVYQNGISEYDYLDSLENIQYPDEMCWSLIYRKLDGNRGCTAITDAEYEMFEKKLTCNNIILQGESYSFNKELSIIVNSEQKYIYTGREIQITNLLLDIMKNKAINKKAFEHFLQYFVILALKNNNYTKILDDKSPISWMGNEVVSSVGIHRIDILAIQENDDKIYLNLIELKDEKINSNIIKQLIGYVRWLNDYISPYYLRKKKQVIIRPIIISDGIPLSRVQTKDKLNQIESEIKSYIVSLPESAVKIENIKIIHFNENFSN